MAEAMAASVEYFEADEFEHGTSAEYTDPWCDICYDKTGNMIRVDAFCPECNNFMCYSCNEHHRLFPVLKKHKVLRNEKIPKSQSDKPVKYPNCSVHAGNLTDHYCIDHSEMICSECSKQSHQSCQPSTVSYICKKLGSTDIQEFENIIDILKQDVMSKTSALENNVSDIENQKEELITQAQVERDNLISSAEKMYEDTVSMISDECEQRKRSIAEQLSTLENMIHSLDETTRDISKKRSLKFDQNLFIKMQQIVETVREYKADIENMNKQMHKITLSFTTSSDVSEFMSDSKYLGNIRQLSSQFGSGHSYPEVIFPQASAITIELSNGKMQTDIVKSKINKVTPLNIRLEQDEAVCCTSGMGVTSKGSLLVSDEKNKSVKLFSRDSKFLSCLPFSVRLSNSSVIDDQTAVVSTHDNQLKIIDISDPRNILFDTSVYLEYRAAAMAPYKDNLIILSLKEPKSVKMINLKGQEKWSVCVDYKGQQLFSEPRAVTVNVFHDTATVIVGDWGKDTLTLVDPNDGHLIKTMDVKGKSPFGLTSDNDGNVYVCYYRTREICVYSPDFRNYQMLLSGSDLSGNPLDIVYDGNRRFLYISYVCNDAVDCFQIA